MFNFLHSSKNVNKTEKAFLEIDKRILEMEKYVNSIIDENEKSLSNKSKLKLDLFSHNTNYGKKLSSLNKELENFYKFIFDPKTFSETTFEYFMEKNVIKTISNYICLFSNFNNIHAIKLVYLVLEKMLFSNEVRLLLERINSSLEFLLMNSSVINSIKILIHTFLATINLTLINGSEFDENFIDLVISFLFNLLEKLMIFPNFYNAISSNNNLQSGKNMQNFDSSLFELIIELFSKEYLLGERASKSKLRKCLLYSLNLENFYTINVTYIEKMLDYLVENLIRYYESYKLNTYNKFLLQLNDQKEDKFSISNFRQSTSPKNSSSPNKKEMLNLIKKEKIGEQEYNNLIKTDIISYLKFFSMILYCFSESPLKTFTSNTLFNKFFLEHCQKDILNLNINYMSFSENAKILKVLEFFYFFTKYMKNKEIGEIFFYFIFGFSGVKLQESDFTTNFIHSEEEGDVYNENFDHLENHFTQEIFQDSNNHTNKEEIGGVSISIHDIKMNIESIFQKDKTTIDDEHIYSNKKSFLKNYMKIPVDKNSHKFENIIIFVINLLETKELPEYKIILLNILTNIVKNTSHLFLVELIVPSYLQTISSNIQNNTDKIIERISNTRDKIDLVEILKNIHPKHFPLKYDNWIDYFVNNLEVNSERNFFMIDNLDLDMNAKQSEIQAKKEADNNLTAQTNGSVNQNSLNNSGVFLENNFIDNYNNYTRRNNFGNTVNTTTSYSTFPNNEDTDPYNNYYNESPSNSSISPNNNSNSHSQNITNLRINFFEVLKKYFKNFSLNNYKENLFLTKLFLEIYSIPYLFHMGNQGENIYNIYSNVTFAGKKKFGIFNIGSVGMIQYISNTLDEIVRFNYTKEEIIKIVNEEYKNKQTQDETPEKSKSNNKSKSTNTFQSKSNLSTHSSNSDENNKRTEFKENLLLFIEFYKEYISSIFTKCYFDQVNANYSKSLVNNY
jgi:hypothetical protein